LAAVAKAAGLMEVAVRRGGRRLASGRLRRAGLRGHQRWAGACVPATSGRRAYVPYGGGRRLRLADPAAPAG